MTFTEPDAVESVQEPVTPSLVRDSQAAADEGLFPRPEMHEDPVSTPPPLDFAPDETGQLCRRLAELAPGGETPETIAVSAELVQRGDEAVGGLELMLYSGRRAVETAALRILIRIGTPRAVAAGIVRLCMEPESDAQQQLIAAFGNARSRMVADTVAVMYSFETRPEYRQNLGAVLAAMEGPEVVDALAERIALSDGEEALRPWLEALGCLSRPSNAESLGNLLLDDSREAVQQAAASVLAGIGDSRACRILAESGSEIPACREALARVRSPYAETALREIAASDPDAGVRAAAQKALAALR